MTETSGVAEPASQPPRTIGAAIRSLEVDTRILGMVGALLVVWIAFHFASNGNFITPRNLWNLSVQSASIAIMATGMVLIIVSRNIDLSVGAMLGFIGYVMGMAQAVWIPTALGLGYDQPSTWVITLALGLTIGFVIGGLQGLMVAYGGVPSFIVTLGGMLIWRGLIFRFQQGQTISPLDKNFQLLGGGPNGSLGDVGSWVLGGIAVAVLAWILYSGRRKRQQYGFPTRPLWGELALVLVGSFVILAAIWTVNSYMWPEALATKFAEANGIVEPPGGLKIPTGIAYPVLILVAVAIFMTYIANRRPFGRYVYAIGGNPDAAELGGINVRRTIALTFACMGVLAAISAAVQTARLNSAVTNLGVQNELDVISAVVIGGTSFAGGIGTIPGAILGAVVMQSLRSGMLLLNVDSPTQDVVVGLVLVAAVGFDSYLRRRAT